VLKPGEIIHSVIIPIPEGIFFQDFIKLGQRRALAISKINLAVSADRLRRNGAGPIKERIRIAMGSVAPTVVRLPKTERLVTGNLHSEKALEKAVRTAAKEVSPIDDIRSSAAYRREMASALVKTALQRLVKFVDEL
jgi:xanthine dehydrogenase FAD-binding subunit